MKKKLIVIAIILVISVIMTLMFGMNPMHEVKMQQVVSPQVIMYSINNN